jgi:segregation and condensation protein A
VSAAKQIFEHTNHKGFQASLKSVVVPPRVTIRQKIGIISTILRDHQRISFKSMITDGASRLDIVVTFLAVLELVKLHFIKVHQDALFSDIELEPTEFWQTDGEIEIEFGE